MTEPLSRSELSEAMLEALNRLMHMSSGTATQADADELKQWRASAPLQEAVSPSLPIPTS